MVLYTSIYRGTARGTHHSLNNTLDDTYIVRSRAASVVTARGASLFSVLLSQRARVRVSVVDMCLAACTYVCTTVCPSVCTDYGVILAEVAHTPHIDLPLRQLASVVLKQYVESHWSHESGKFCEPQVTAEAKRVIKHLLLAILGSEESKIRAAAVSCGRGCGVGPGEGLVIGSTLFAHISFPV